MAEIIPHVPKSIGSNIRVIIITNTNPVIVVIKPVTIAIKPVKVIRISGNQRNSYNELFMMFFTNY